MSSAPNPYEYTPPASVWGNIAVQAPADERADFIRKTYLHLAGAVLAFIGIEAILLQTSLGQRIFDTLFAANGKVGIFILMIGFVGVAYLSESWARSSTSVAMQYAGLGLYVVAESIIMLPLLAYAYQINPSLIVSAALITAILFAGLTAIVVTTGADFSFLRTTLWLVGLGSIVVVLFAIITGKPLGILFSVVMVVLGCGYILYDTSNVMRRYRVGQHVAASLALFASVAFLFYYVLRILMATNRR